MIRWADERFRYYVTKQGPKPVRRTGMDHAKHGFKGWLNHLLAFAIGAGLLALTIAAVGDASRTEALVQTIRVWSLVVGIDFLISVSYFVWPRKAKPH